MPIIIGIGLLLSSVWGADIGGLVTAVGVTSVVIGPAVQTAVGPVIAGLLLLFAQPFRIGDWLDTHREAVGFITASSVGMIVQPRTAAGNCRSVVSESADYIGTTALTPQRMLTRDVALTDTTIVSVPRDAMNIVVQQDPRLAPQIGEAIEIRRNAASEALAEAAQGVRVASRLGQRKRRVGGGVSIASMVVIEIRCQGRSSGRRGGIVTDPLTPMGV